jgi:hypothetical protein
VRRARGLPYSDILGGLGSADPYGGTRARADFDDSKLRRTNLVFETCGKFSLRRHAVAKRFL